MSKTLTTQIRDAMYDRIVAKMTDFKGLRKIPTPPIQNDQVPALGVYIMRENMGPDGDANVGPPRYIVDASISVMVIDLASKPDVLDGSVDARIDAIMNLLLCDSSFLDMRDEHNHPIIDSIPTISRTYQFPRDGETQFVEARLQFTVRFMCYFEPVITNDFDTLGLTVRPSNAAPGDTNHPHPDDFNEQFPIIGS